MRIHKLIIHSAITAALTLTPAAMADTLNKDQVKQVEQIIHSYLVNHPEVLVEASQALQKKEMGKLEEKAQEAIASNADALFADASNPVLGNPKGDITIIEFFDYQCPHCKDMGPIMETIIKNNKEARVVLKELPIFGASSKDATSAALAANLQGSDKYKTFHEALLSAPNPLNKNTVLDIAKKTGLDIEKLQKDMSSDEVQKQIDKNFELAKALELVGTPTFIIGKWEVGGSNNTGKNALFVPGMLDEAGLQDLVDQAKKQAI